MYKIKLLILLLTSLIIFSCAKNKNYSSNQKYSLAYIEGGFDGLLLKNYLIGNLKNLDIYEQNSILEIKANITHNSNLFVTNIDNTSDREKIDTKLSIEIFNTLLDCSIYEDEITVSQFYIYAVGDKFFSNKTALNKIKKDNTETTVRRFINNLNNIRNKCDETK